jgi:hypothetical protein
MSQAIEIHGRAIPLVFSPSPVGEERVNKRNQVRRLPRPNEERGGGTRKAEATWHSPAVPLGKGDYGGHVSR